MSPLDPFDTATPMSRTGASVVDRTEASSLQQSYDVSNSLLLLHERYRGGGGGGTDDRRWGLSLGSVKHSNTTFSNNTTTTTTNETQTTTTPSPPPWSTTTLVSAARVGFQSMTAVAVVLYILNQKHWLPLPISRVVSHTLFWPTLPLTVVRQRWRLGNDWCTEIDDVVVMGGAPFGFAGFPEKLFHKYDVRGVVNFCEEYEGPVQQYEKLGITQLHLPTPDHFEPSLQALEATVQFIQQQFRNGGRVYVHCRAGHGRSAAGVLAWLLAKQQGDPNQASCKTLNQELYQLRKVRKTLWKQETIQQFHAKLQQQHAGLDGTKLADHGSFEPEPHPQPDKADAESKGYTDTV